MKKSEISRRSFLHTASVGAGLLVTSRFVPSGLASPGDFPEGIYRIECVRGGKQLDRDFHDTGCILGKDVKDIIDPKTGRHQGCAGYRHHRSI